MSEKEPKAEWVMRDALKSFPESVQQCVRHQWAQYIEALKLQKLSPPRQADFLRVMLKVWACSSFVAGYCVVRPEMFEKLMRSGDLLIAYGDDNYTSSLSSQIDQVANEAELKRLLRYFRQREMVRIAWRDLAGWSALEETLRDLTLLADACVSVSLAKLYQWQVDIAGTPQGNHRMNPQSMVVLAMGKMGAYELNFSSDIDLIFAYPEEGETQGKRRRISNEEFFTGIGRQLIDVLNAQTEDGFVYRVDMRLRPYGNSGPLVMSFDAMEEYYQSQGREWERYAMIKARPVAGHPADCELLMRVLKPFIYRRYLDFGTFEQLREMKAMVNREVAHKGMTNNVKLGPGGIREIEFIGQAYQLIRGGREVELQQRSILKVLKSLVDLGHLPDYVSNELSEAYDFLRRVENRLQAFADEQTHTLYEDSDDRQRLAISMGFRDWAPFQRELSKVRNNVQAHFEQIFALSDSDRNDANPHTVGVTQMIVLWRDEQPDAQAVNMLESAGFDSADEAWQKLKQLKNGYAYRTSTSRGKELLDRLVPMMLGAMVETEDPFVVLQRILELLESISRRTAYLALLIENPMAMSQVVKLCAASPWIASLLSDHPILLDELLDPRTLYAPLDHDTLVKELRAQLRALDGDDVEAQLEALRHFKQTNVLRVAAAEVMGVMPLMVVSDHLTEIAEVILDEVLKMAVSHLVKRKEKVKESGENNQLPGFAIIAYGKLGGIELGYGSDLDLVFLHEKLDETATSDAVFFIRLGQRIIHLLNTHTSSGILYDVDMRLRPSGASGLLVSDIHAFEEYQMNEAWTWEHQALVRARVVAGDPKIAEAFEDLRSKVLSTKRDDKKLHNDVKEMRERMRNELSKSKAGHFDIKQDAGGIADIEFIVQYGVLRWTHKYANLTKWTDNIRLLASLAKTPMLTKKQAALLSDAYRVYRSRVHERVLQQQSAIVSNDELTEYRRGVKKIWDKLFAD
ncbi:MAG: bifunctional [glutamate--ammonia ligase]-adenylyl-L-tyrosine phosphorylase/[glutamate--ammonia-ligase] adenylyltransferase [Gammaproteobacteria bacterium]